MITEAIRVLVADDDRTMREALVDLLRDEEGIEVVGAVGDGASVADAAAAFEPDVIVIDVGMSGPASMRLLHDQRPGLRVVAMSSDPNRASAMLDAGAAAFVLKAAPDDLVEVVRDAARRDPPA